MGKTQFSPQHLLNYSSERAGLSCCPISGTTRRPGVELGFSKCLPINSYVQIDITQYVFIHMCTFATFQTFLSVFCDPSQTSNLGRTFCDYCFRWKVQGFAAIDVVFFQKSFLFSSERNLHK